MSVTVLMTCYVIIEFQLLGCIYECVTDFAYLTFKPQFSAIVCQRLLSVPWRWNFGKEVRVCDTYIS